MLRKWNRFLAYLLAMALIASTFHSDFATIRVYADGDEIVETSADETPKEEPAAEPATEPEQNTQAEPENNYEEPASEGEPAEPAENPDPAPENEDPQPEQPQDPPAEPAAPETPSEDTPTDEASAGITDPADIPDDVPGDVPGEGDDVEDDAAALGSSVEDDAAALGSSEVEDDAAALGSSEKEEKEEEEELEEKLVTVSYSAQLGGRVSRTSETININDKTAKFEGSTATAVNKYYQFMSWVDDEGNTVSSEATFIPSDVKEDTSFTARFEKLSNMPAQSFEKSAGGMNVSVEATEGIFPEDTTMVVTAVSDDEALAAATDALGDAVSTAKGVDITFYNADGEEIEPADSKYVKVNISLATALEGEEFKVVHKDDSGYAEEIADANANGAEFQANSFSVYVLAGVDDSINRKVATYIFKVFDFESRTWNVVSEQFLQDGDTLVNPGIPEPTDSHQTFRGWFREDTGAQITTFGSVEVNAVEEIVVKAKVEITYHVELVGIGGEVVQVLEAVAVNDDPATVTINSTVQVSAAEQAFVGWKNLAGTVYEVGSTIDATDANNKKLVPEIVQAYWINFDENDGGDGGGASYTAPIYVTSKTNYIATEPTAPTRRGYEFKGWYRDAAGTQAFNWNSRVQGNITLYAKWQKGKGSFTVIIWKQKSTDLVDANPKTYDYEDSIVISNYDVDASINDTMLGTTIRKNYVGFTYGSNDGQGKTIAAKGTTVVNVYYNRKTITFNFYTKNGNRDKLETTMKGLYESTLAANGYTWPIDREWHEGSYNGTRTTFLDAFLFEEKTTVNFYSDSNTSGTYHYYHYKQNIDGSTYPTTASNEAVKIYEKKFEFTDKYTGFSVCGYTDATHPSMQAVHDGSSVTVYGDTKVYHKRNSYKFSLVHLKEKIDPATGKVVETEEVKVAEYSLLYEAPLSGKQAAVLADASALSAPDGYKLKKVGSDYIFSDTAGTTPVNWNSTMPASDDTRVYVIWTKERFRALLDENWDDDKNISTKLGTETAPLNDQSTDFEPWYGTPISREALMNNFVRPGYELIGWFNLADGTPYDYANVTADVNIYAEWRRTGTINIAYNAGEGTLDPAYVDTHDYAAKSAVVVTAPPTPPAKKIFAGWELLDSAGNVVALYYPNSIFTIVDSLIVTISADKGVVNLRAKYDDAGIIDDSIYTTITYDANDGSGRSETISTTGDDNHRLRVNEAIRAWDKNTALSKFARPGYEILGWNTDKSAADAGTVTISFDAEYILADNENNPGNSSANILYAVWKPVVKVVVTVEGKNDSQPYDGTEKSISGFTVTAIKYLINGNEVQMSGFSADDVKLAEGATATASRTIVGKTVMGLTESSFVSTNTQFLDVKFDVTDGYMEITPVTVEVKVTGNHDIKAYDGTEHSVTDYTIDGGGIISQSDISYSGTAEAKRTDFGTTPMNLDITKFSYTGDPNYVVSFTLVADGYMQITPIDITVNIIGNYQTFIYDGTAHTVEGYTFNSTYPYTEDDFTFTGSASVSRTDEGTSWMKLKDSDFSNKNPNYANVTFSITQGYVTITPIDEVVVTIVGNKTSVNYDGQEHTASGYEITNISNSLYKESDFTFSGTAKVTKTDAGTYPMGLAAGQFTNNSTNFSNVVFAVTDGELAIAPISVTVTINGNKATTSYNGSEQSVTGYQVAGISTDLYTEADFTFTGTAEAKGTDVNTYQMSISANDFENNNKNFDTVIFDVTPGELVITPVAASAKIIGNNSSDPYDGNDHNVTGYTVEIPEGSYIKEADIVFSGGTASATRKEVGTTYMGLEENMFSTNSSNFSSVTFIVEDGYQDIKPIDVTVTIVGHTGKFDYDGNEHTVSGYDVTNISSNLYTVNDFTYSGTQSVTKTDAGTYPLGLEQDKFNNTNRNFGTVTFEVTDGSLEISAIDGVTVTITGNTANVPYTGAEQSVTGYGATTSNSLYTEDDFMFKGTAKVTGIDADTYPMGLASDQFVNTNPNFTNVSFAVTDGSLTITPITAEVNIIGYHDSQTYDGNEHEITGYEVEIVTTGYKREYFAFNGEASAKRTDVGTTYMELEGKFENKNSNYSEVTFHVTDGYMEIVPRGEVKVTITGNHDVVDYTGAEQSVTGYTVDISDPLYKEEYFEFKGDATAKGIDADTYYMNIDETMVKNISDNFDNVTFEVVPGYLTINPIAITVNIAGKNDTVVYNGTEQKIEGFDATSESALFDATKVIYDGDAIAKGTDVGTYDMNLDVEKFKYDDPNFANVTFAITADGFLVIDPEELVITITGKEDTLEYNGREQEVTGFTATSDSEFFDESKVALISGEARAHGKYVGDYDMGLKEEQFKYNDKNLVASYIINDGVLHIIDRTDKFVITATTTDVHREYNGETYSGFGYDVAGGRTVSQQGNAIANIVEFITGVLSPIKASADDGSGSGGDVYIDGVKFTVSGLHVDTSAREVGEYDLIISGDMVVRDEDGEDVTGQFTLEKKEGKLYIEKRNMVITSGSASKVHDGYPLTNGTITLNKPWATGDRVNITVTGTQTEVGSSANTFTLQPMEGTDFERNYNIRTVFGTLEVTQAPITNPDPPIVIPTPPTTIVDTPAPLAPAAPAPIVDAAVLGATRTNGAAVLGARRAKTEDATTTIPRVFAMIAAAAVMAALLATFRRKKEEEQ